MRLKALVQGTWKRLAGLTLLYLLVSLISGFYFTQSHYLQFVDQQLMTARSQIWFDGAEMGERPETQSIFKLKSQILLDQVSWKNPLQIFSQCHTVSLLVPSSNENELGLPFTFSLDLSPEQTSDLITIRCQLQGEDWLFTSVVLAVLSILLISFHPRPLKSDDLTLLKRLRLLVGESVDQKHWKKAIEKFREANPNKDINEDYLSQLLKSNSEQFLSIEDKVTLLEQASRPLTLSFLMNNGNVEVRINEVAIPMSITPAIYWLWYAKKRISEQNDGWVLNPPSNRPSQTLASELITLMESHGGHGRAISELKQHGLKAKTLDQNRNKIKDALVNVLGESFVDQLGFESDKQADTAQSIYRVKISPNAILING
ncbi:hypothetical protein [Vibrio sp. STUT-A11]|uniref:hypothetical protein n=1 Tax=Vibrio sp. STUT-A11 TaxID=2976236 RepID=UPI00222EE44C|nr:hypothetical protein [Vibrio sp. STUT-A11]BDR16476.1 hypothetical protein VspSTUT11_44520 [Vibrio sp. STUT-A11]